MSKEYNGEVFQLTINDVAQERLNTEKVKSKLTPAMLKECTDVVTFQQYRTKRLAGTKEAFKMPNLENATPSGLIDMLGDVREQIADLKRLEGIYKTALEARLKKEEEDKKK